MDLTCTIKDCKNKPVCRSWCGMHYTRYKRHGDPEKMVKPYMNTKRYLYIQKSFPLWIEEYNSGNSVSSISKKFKVNEVTVYKYLRQNNVEIDKYSSMRGKNNPMWKGDEVGYGALHDYVKSKLVKPSRCENCLKNKPLDLANISQLYKRDLTDWVWLCRSCHMQQDGRLKRLHFCEKCGHNLRKKI